MNQIVCERIDGRYTKFLDDLSLTGGDPDHSVAEERFITFSVSNAGRLLVISHTDRGNRIRIISARPATPSERRICEEGCDVAEAFPNSQAVNEILRRLIELAKANVYISPKECLDTFDLAHYE